MYSATYAVCSMHYVRYEQAGFIELCERCDAAHCRGALLSFIVVVVGKFIVVVVGKQNGPCYSRLLL